MFLCTDPVSCQGYNENKTQKKHLMFKTQISKQIPTYPSTGRIAVPSLHIHEKIAHSCGRKGISFPPCSSFAKTTNFSTHDLVDFVPFEDPSHGFVLPGCKSKQQEVGVTRKV